MALACLMTLVIILIVSAPNTTPRGGEPRAIAEPKKPEIPTVAPTYPVEGDTSKAVGVTFDDYVETTSVIVTTHEPIVTKTADGWRISFQP